MRSPDDHEAPDNIAIAERSSLRMGKGGNLLMAAAGIAAAYASHSDALLVDGLYSGVNFVSAIIAGRVSLVILRPADRHYPFGYDAYEALYVKYRSLVLLGILTYAALGAVSKIITYATGGSVPQLVFGPILVYSVAMVAICFGLAAWHRYNWIRTGRRSELLQTETRAALVDGVISVGAGAGLLSASLLEETPLAFLVPVSDAIIVLILCACVIRKPLQMFLAALREVAGASADEATRAIFRQQVEAVLTGQPMTLLELAVTKLGRTHFVVAYVKPDTSVSGEEADALRAALEQACVQAIPDTKTELVIAATAPT